jgi:hypothetical protein
MNMLAVIGMETPKEERVANKSLENRQSSESAVVGVEIWMAKVREERVTKLKRAGSWVRNI